MGAGLSTCGPMKLVVVKLGALAFARPPSFSLGPRLVWGSPRVSKLAFVYGSKL